MEEERRSLSLTAIAKSLYPGSEFTLEAQNISDKFDSTLEVLLERNQQLKNELSNACAQVYYLQKHCGQLSKTLNEAKDGNVEVLENDHSRFISDHPHDHRSDVRPSRKSSNDKNDDPYAPPYFLRRSLKEAKNVVKTEGYKFRSGRKNRIEQNNHVNEIKVERRGRKKKILSQESTVPRKRMFTENTSSSSYNNKITEVERATDGPYILRSKKQLDPHPLYTDSIIIDALVEPDDNPNSQKYKGNTKDDDDTYIDYKDSKLKKKREALKIPGSKMQRRQKKTKENNTKDDTKAIPLKSSFRSIKDYMNPQVTHNTQYRQRKKPSETENSIGIQAIQFNGSRHKLREKQALSTLKKNPSIIDNPEFPIVLSKKCKLLKLGEICPLKLFYTNRIIYPVGYEVEREFRSMIAADKMVNYTLRISKEGDHPLFHVIPEDAPHLEIISPSPSGAWSELLKRVNDSFIPGKRANTASGIEYYCLGHAIPKLLIEQLPDADKCVGYKFVHPDKQHLNIS